MPIDLIGIDVRSERRIRLLFSNELDTGAFGLSPTLYTIESTDGRGVDPNVDAALVVPESPTLVELALDEDLVQSGQYTITVVDVPAIDLSLTGTQSQGFRFGDPENTQNKEIGKRNWDLVLYGEDIIWSGVDFVENSSGDLSTSKGIPVVHKALLKRAMASGLPWDPSYGARPSEYVDAVVGLMPTLRGALLSELKKDDRVKRVQVNLLALDESKTVFSITPTLAGNNSASEPITLEVPQG